MSLQTDNKQLGLKVSLRRDFISRYHADGKPTVLDCCEGQREIWKRIMADRDYEYVGLDMKPERGRLKIDSRRFLNNPGWSFDIIDIDTYGLPWAHYLAALKRSPKSFTVFLTVGCYTIGGSKLNFEVKRILKLGSVEPPAAICADLNKSFTIEMISEASRRGWNIIEIKEAVPFKKGTARYFGVRLEKC